MVEDIPLERRPNPPGWVPPPKGSNYNPYDPMEQRPPQGYPSEFKTPGKKSTRTRIPQDATQYQHMKETMQKLQYTPRPKSKLYPGQYQVLRRVDNYPKFYKGAVKTSKFMVFGVIAYSMFFYRWNDGFDHIWSDLYRTRLKIKYFINGELTKQEFEDLNSKQRGYIKSRSMGTDMPELEDSKIRNDKKRTDVDSKYVMETPNPKHLKEAERILQERDEKIMRAIDIAEEQLALGNIEKSALPRKKFLGIF